MAATTGRPPVLSRRALNRALLARQLLLERSTMPVLDAVHHLVGLQAQAPWSPYHALWARLEGFDPHELGALLTKRRTVRIVLMRSTVHWVTAEDCLFLRPLLAGFLERALLTSPWRSGLQDLDHDAVAEAARRLVEEEPMTFRQLGLALAERWPGRDPATLAQLARARVPLVQLPPRAVWGRTGQVVVTTAEAWLGRPLDPAPDPERMLLRYLAAFGPASVMDAQTWCGLTRLGEVADRLGDRVVRFRDEDGRELLDLPDAPRPDPDTPAPVRFLPDFDNLLVSHADRRRVVDDEDRRRIARVTGAYPGHVLVDGRVAALWVLTRRKGTATLVVTALRPLSRRERDEVVAEGAALLGFAAPGLDPDVRVVGLGEPGAVTFG